MQEAILTFCNLSMEGKYLVCDYLVVLLLLWHWVSMWWFTGVRAHVIHFAKKINYAFNVHLLILKKMTLYTQLKVMHLYCMWMGAFGWRMKWMLFTYCTSLINTVRRWNEDETVNCNFCVVCWWRLCSDIHIRIYYQRFNVHVSRLKWRSI